MVLFPTRVEGLGCNSYAGPVSEIKPRSVRRLLVTTNIASSSQTLVTLMMEALRISETWFLQDPYGVISQKTAFLKRLGSVTEISICFINEPMEKRPQSEDGNRYCFRNIGTIAKDPKLANSNLCSISAFRSPVFLIVDYSVKWNRVTWMKFNDVSEKHIAVIFIVE
jgi:hypothetical protein